MPRSGHNRKVSRRADPEAARLKESQEKDEFPLTRETAQATRDAINNKVSTAKDISRASSEIHRPSCRGRSRSRCRGRSRGSSSFFSSSPRKSLTPPPPPPPPPPLIIHNEQLESNRLYGSKHHTKEILVQTLFRVQSNHLFNDSGVLVLSAKYIRTIQMSSGSI